MTPEEIKAYIHETAREVALSVNNSTKQENSGLVGDLKEVVTSILEENKKVREDFAEHKKIVYEHFEKDNEWKVKKDLEREEDKPAIDVIKKGMSFWSVSGTIFKGIILIGVVGTTIVGALHFIKNWLHS